MTCQNIKIDSAITRAVSAIVLALVLVFAYFSGKWSLANSASTNTDLKEVAALTAEFAPDDPQTHYAAAVLHENSIDFGDHAKSLAEYETAAALSPHNYLLWLELARSRERHVDAEQAEAAYRKAVELAPNYARPRWALGNFLVREERPDEAFGEIRNAIALDPQYSEPAVGLAWQVFDGDIALIRQTLGDSINLNLAFFLAGSKRFDASFAIWESLSVSEAEKDYFFRHSEAFFNQLIEAGKFIAARKVYARIYGENEDGISRVANGDFENAIKSQGRIFEWQISDGAQPQIAVSDSLAHSGSRSLWLIYNSSDGRNLRSVAQTIAVTPGQTYNFTAYYRSEIKSKAALKWEIVEAKTEKLIAEKILLPDAADWNRIEIKFSVPENSAEAIVIRLKRGDCGSPICPISGNLWIDNISLSIIG